METKLIEIIKQLEKVCKECNLKVTDETLLVQACSFLRGEKAGESKKPIEDKKNTSPKKKATDKQMAYAQKLADKKKINLKINGDESAFEISQIIKGLLKD